MLTSFERECREILCEIATNGETYEKDLSFNKATVIIFMLCKTELSSITTNVLTDLFFKQTIRADILAEIILCELD